MDAVDVIGLAGSSTTYGAVLAGFKVKFRVALPGGFGNKSVEGNRARLGQFPIQTADPSLWEPQRGVCYLCGVPPCSGFSVLNTAAEMAAKHGSKSANFRGAASPINECQRALVLYAARCTGGDGKPGPEVVCFESVQGAYTKGLDLMREYHQLLKAATGQPYALHHLLHSDASLGGAQARPRYFWVAARVPFGVDYERPPSVPSYEDVMGDLAKMPTGRGPQVRVADPSEWAMRLADTPEVTWHVAHTTNRLEESLRLLFPLWPAGTSVSAPLARYATANGGQSPPGAASGWWKDGRLNMFESNIRRVSGGRRGCWVIPGGCEAKFAHWGEDRFLTVREFARLMSLPDSWSFDYTERIHDAVNMTAKACPVTSARWVAEAARDAVIGRPQGRGRLSQVAEDEFLMDVTDEWKAALPAGYDAKRHTQGAYAEAAGAPRPTAPIQARRAPDRGVPTPRAARAPQKPVLEARQALPGSPGQPRATARWGGGPVKDFWQFVHERQAVWTRRGNLRPRPWTDDPVMAARFFTNVFRELDPGTKVAERVAELGQDRPAWEQLWNLVLYRRFNRETTWEVLTAGEGYVRAADWTDVALEIGVLENRVRAHKASKEAVFTDAHQVFPLNDVPGEDLIRRIFVCADWAVDDFPPLVDKVVRAGSVKEAFHLIRDGAGDGIASFLGWQLTLDAQLGPRPVVHVFSDEWAPVTTGARVGLILHINWPNYGIVGSSPVDERFAGLPKLAPVPAAQLEEKLRQMRDAQDQEFEARGLDFQAVAAPGHPRLTLAALEHALCEWQKYLSISLDGPSSYRIYDRDAERKDSTGAMIRDENNSSTAIIPVPSRSVKRRLAAQRPGVPTVVVQPAWSSLPGPTALARLMVGQGNSDDEILAATKATFGGRAEGPHLFTRTDLARLRSRIDKAGGAKA